MHRSSSLLNPTCATGERQNDTYRMALQILCAMVVVTPFCFDFTGLAVNPVLLCWFSNCDAMSSTIETVDKSNGWKNSMSRSVLQIKTGTI